MDSSAQDIFYALLHKHIGGGKASMKASESQRSISKEDKSKK